MPKLISGPPTRRPQNAEEYGDTEEGPDMQVAPGNPAFQSNSKVGSRKRVDERKAQYTWRYKTSAGLTPDQIRYEEIKGWRGPFNTQNLKSVTKGTEKQGDISVPIIIRETRNNQPKVRYKSTFASEGAKRRNNWIVYVRLTLANYARIQEATVGEYVLEELKFPQAVANTALQAMFHAKDGDQDCPVPPSHFAVFFNTDSLKREFTEVMRKLQTNAVQSTPGKPIYAENPFDVGHVSNMRQKLNEYFDDLVDRVIVPESAIGKHYWPFRYTDNSSEDLAIHKVLLEGVTQDEWENEYKDNLKTTIKPIARPSAPAQLAPSTPDGYDQAMDNFIDGYVSTPSSRNTTQSKSTSSKKRKTRDEDIAPLGDDDDYGIGEIPMDFAPRALADTFQNLISEYDLAKEILVTILEKDPNLQTSSSQNAFKRAMINLTADEKRQMILFLGKKWPQVLQKSDLIRPTIQKSPRPKQNLTPKKSPRINDNTPTNKYGTISRRLGTASPDDDDEYEDEGPPLQLVALKDIPKNKTKTRTRQQTIEYFQKLKDAPPITKQPVTRSKDTTTFFQKLLDAPVRGRKETSEKKKQPSKKTKESPKSTTTRSGRNVKQVQKLSPSKTQDGRYLEKKVVNYRSK